MMRVFIVLLALCLLPESYAAEVVKVKGKSALINLNGDPAVIGDQFYLVTADGKRRALIRISKVKGDKAIGKITKGKAAAGMTLELKSGTGGSSGGGSPSYPTPSSGGSFGDKKSYWGAIAGFSMDSMTVNVRDGTTGAVRSTESLSGSAFSAKGLFDYELFNSIWFRGTAGLEGFSAAGPSACGVANNEACTASIYYLSFDFLARYVLGKGNFRPWAGGGVGLLFPASKESTALDSSSISRTNVIILGGGIDWFMSPRLMIPISVEYGLLPKSDEVEASWIAVRAGFAVPF